MMIENEREKMREYVNRWRETGEFLEKLRREEIRNSNLAETIGVFDDAFRSALWLKPAEKTSGLVEFHKILAKSK
ncbi:MAG: hypothetical protein ACR2GD_00650 [Pyrinomonadaceae bacterium]